MHRSIINTMRHGDFFNSAAGFSKVMWGGMIASDKKGCVRGEIGHNPVCIPHKQPYRLAYLLIGTWTDKHTLNLSVWHHQLQAFYQLVTCLSQCLERHCR